MDFDWNNCKKCDGKCRGIGEKDFNILIPEVHKIINENKKELEDYCIFKTSVFNTILLRYLDTWYCYVIDIFCTYGPLKVQNEYLEISALPCYVVKSIIYCHLSIYGKGWVNQLYIRDTFGVHTNIRLVDKLEKYLISRNVINIPMVRCNISCGKNYIINRRERKMEVFTMGSLRFILPKISQSVSNSILDMIDSITLNPITKDFMIFSDIEEVEYLELRNLVISLITSFLASFRDNNNLLTSTYSIHPRHKLKLPDSWHWVSLDWETSPPIYIIHLDDDTKITPTSIPIYSLIHEGQYIVNFEFYWHIPFSDYKTINIMSEIFSDPKDLMINKFFYDSNLSVTTLKNKCLMVISKSLTSKKLCPNSLNIPIKERNEVMEFKYREYKVKKAINTFKDRFVF